MDRFLLQNIEMFRRPFERGQGMVEYAFIVSLVALVVLLAVMILGKQVNNTFSNISSSLNRGN